MSVEPPLQSAQARQLIRSQGRVHEREVAIVDNGGSYRTSLMQIAMDCYQEIPDTYTQRYDPESHRIIIDLPEPAQRRLDEFGDAP